MSLGLKNAKATYQQMMNKILRKQIGWNIETYVDDMVIKIKRGRSHLEDDIHKLYYIFSIFLDLN